jgi:hypothetical protein
MVPPAEELCRIVLAFREAHGRAYLARLGQSEEPVSLPRPRMDEFLERVRDSRGDVSAEEHAALAAHVARMVLELKLAEARAERLALPEETLRVDSSERTVGSALDEWLVTKAAPARRRLTSAVLPLLEAHNLRHRAALQYAEGAAGDALRIMDAARHPDAGPEDGSRQLASDWLTSTADLAAEAFAEVRRLHEVTGNDGEDTLWAVQAPRYASIFPREDRFRRLGAELVATGLLEGLRRHVRVTFPQPDLLCGTQVVALRVPTALCISPSNHPLGLASEWRAAEAVGRAAALAGSTPVGFPALRHPAAGSVARAIGAATASRFLAPELLRRDRGLSRREAVETARCALACFLFETRLLAAGVLGRGRPERELHALVERALGTSLAPALSVFLATRTAASAVLRGKIWGLAVASGLRDRFDGDWHRNPRVAETLCGAAARGGSLSVEGLADELRVSIREGIRLCEELF